LWRSYSTWSVADHHGVDLQLTVEVAADLPPPFAGPPKPSRSLHHSAKLFPVSFFTFSSDTTLSERSVTFIADLLARPVQRNWAEL
jgi:hypothetical protein